MRKLLFHLTLLSLGVIFATAGCQSTDLNPQSSPPPETRAKPAASESVIEKYSYFELFAANELLSRVLAVPTDFPIAEGEGSFGCRLDAQSAQRWLPPLRALIADQQRRQRESYLRNPVHYQRSAGAERCGPSCSCGALNAVLKGVKLKDLKSPQLRLSHRESLRKLNVKSSRLDPDESYSCLRRAAWFCTSDLRDFLDSQGPVSRITATESSP